MLAPIPESSSRVEDASTQPGRPSVTWDLGPYKDYDTPTKTTTGSVANRNFRFRREPSAEFCPGVHPQICFLRPQTSQPLVLFSIMNSSEAAMQNFLPKSHLSRVIIRDNVSAQRIYELEVRASDKTKKKMGHLYDHLKKKFMTDQLRKLGRWRRESMNIQQYLDKIRTHKQQLKLQSPKKNHTP